MIGTKREGEHFQFIESTDRKSLHTQIKALVTKAQALTAEELQERSSRLKSLLEAEDQVYEEEFSNKVKSRIDEDIRARKAQLHEIKELHDKRQKKFLETKRVQQVMECCYEIREALRQEDLKNTKICQEEQILENERKKRRECEVAEYWRKLEQRRWDEYDRNEYCEMCQRQQITEQMRHTLKLQVEELEEKRQQEVAEKREEARELAKVLEEMRLEQFEEEHRPASDAKFKYRDELLAQIARRKAERDALWLAEKQEHQAFICETQRLEAEAKARIQQGKLDTNKATLEYLGYVKRMRALELGIEKMMDARTSDLNHVDICTKSNIAEMRRLKGIEAAKCHAILKQQICEEADRRLRWDAELREPKIIENRFVHPEVTREMVIAKYRKNRADLDAQIVELNRVRAEEEKRTEVKLLKAIDDPEVCTQLAAQYIREGRDYLTSHPNWKIYVSPEKKYVGRPPMKPEQLEARLREASVDTCPFPEAARCHCSFMANQKPVVKPEVPAKQPPLSDVPPEGQMMKPGPNNCLCVTAQRGHINLHKK